MTHTKNLMYPYPVWLLNIFCCLIFVELLRHTFHTMSTSMVFTNHVYLMIIIYSCNTSDAIDNGRGPAQDVPFFYTPSHL